MDVHHNAWGGRDVIIRIDGSYATEADAHDVARSMGRGFARAARRAGLELEDWDVPEPDRKAAKP